METALPSLRRRDLAVAVLSGALLALALPGANSAVGWLAWFAPAPFLCLALPRRRWRDALALYATFGGAFNLMALRWFDGVYPLTWLGYTWWQSLVLVAGIWLTFALLATAHVCVFGLLYNGIVRSWGTPGLRHAVVFALGWCALEWAESFTLWGYSGFDLVLTQWRLRPFLQALDLAGPYPMSGLMIFVSASLALIWWHRARGYKAVGAMAPAAFLLLATLAYGVWRLNVPSVGSAFTVGLVQGDLIGTERWDPNASAVQQMADTYVRLAASLGPTALMVWPETAVPGYVNRWPQLEARLANEAVTRRDALLTGAFESGAQSQIYNAVYGFSGDGRLLGTYRKRHLVPFAEYLPTRSLWAGPLRPFAEPLGILATIQQDVIPGDAPGLFQMPFGAVGVGICFDAMSPALMRETVLDGANVLAICANDVWCRDPYGAYLMGAGPVLRAIEEHRWVVVAANSGISSIIDPTGRIVARTPLMCRAELRGQAMALSDWTLYSRLGDGIAQILAMVFLALWGLGLRTTRGAIAKGPVNAQANRE